MRSTQHHAREKSGLNSISIAIILITIIIAVAGIAYIWMAILNRSGNRIYIHSVSFQQAKTAIYVQNIGNQTVTISTVQIGNEAFTIAKTNCTVGTENTTTVTPSQTAQITIDHAYNQTVHVKVICTDGTSHEADWQP